MAPLSHSDMLLTLKRRIDDISARPLPFVGKLQDIAQHIGAMSSDIKVIQGVCHRDFDSKNVLCHSEGLARACPKRFFSDRSNQ